MHPSLRNHKFAKKVVSDSTKPSSSLGNLVSKFSNYSTVRDEIFGAGEND